MGKRRSDSRKLQKSATPALGLLLVLTGAAPVLASQNLPTDCTELENAGLEAPIIMLAAATAGEKAATETDATGLNARSSNNAAAAPLLNAPAEALPKPGRFERAAPFVEPTPADDTVSSTPQGDESADELPEIRTRFPGVSSAELKRFKRQMYRRDI